MINSIKNIIFILSKDKFNFFSYLVTNLIEAFLSIILLILIKDITALISGSIDQLYINKFNSIIITSHNIKIIKIYRI